MGEDMVRPDTVSSSSSSSSASFPPASGGDNAEEASQDPVAAALAACEGGAAASSRQESRIKACDDPALAPPKSSRADWEAEMKQIRKVVEDPNIGDDEKVRLLNEALMQRIEDTRNLEESKALALKRLEDTGKENDRCKSEVTRTVALKLKLEGSCREQQQQSSSLSKENQRIAEEERARHSELKEKFQQAIKDVQEKMDAELEVRQHFLRENEDLRSKLQKFNETYEAQEAQLAEQRESRAKEMEVATERLREHEAMCGASRAKRIALEKENEAFKVSHTKLREELQTILGKFDEFSKAVTGSNTRHSECKEEIDTLQTQMQDLEKENTSLKENSRLQQLNTEHQVAQKQSDALDKLCDNLQKENKKLMDQLKQKKK
eukprot:TRINITY_DN67165_c0_g1_i1.p1 TRINITY_DN67165_c0_g1~~TRINITY_DN67165_c0_g1_i1.p1  ORF type:complete len:379 (-),score=110.15 TRINITY_DN67165_c0_g1_i1:108-1244(-)